MCLSIKVDRPDKKGKSMKKKLFAPLLVLLLTSSASAVCWEQAKVTWDATLPLGVTYGHKFQVIMAQGSVRVPASFLIPITNNSGNYHVVGVGTLPTQQFTVWVEVYAPDNVTYVGRTPVQTVTDCGGVQVPGTNYYNYTFDLDNITAAPPWTPSTSPPAWERKLDVAP